MSLPEVLLWRQLKLRPHDLKFRRQHRHDPYTLDFYCAQHSLAVEIDGFAHDCGDRPARDARRDMVLRQAGLTVLRVSAGEVLADAAAMAEAIASCAASLPARFIITNVRRSAPSDPLRGPHPRQVGEDRGSQLFQPNPTQLVGKVAARSADGGAHV